MWVISQVRVFGRATGWKATLLEILLKALLHSIRNFGLLLKCIKMGLGNGKKFPLSSLGRSLIESKPYISKHLVKRTTPWCGNSPLMGNLVWHLLLTSWPLLSCLSPLHSQTIGFGEWTHCLKSNISFGCATMRAYRWGKSSRQEASIAMVFALCIC